MKRKKIVRWLALGIFVLLIGFTIASNLVYEALLPRVETTEFMASMSTEREIEYWVPEECVFGTEDSQSIVLYRVGERSGLFSMEYYVEQIDGQVLEEKDGQVKVQAPAMGMMETRSPPDRKSASGPGRSPRSAAGNSRISPNNEAAG